MELWKAMEQRHSVRAYTARPIEGETLARLSEAIRQANQQSGLHFQLVREEPNAFSGGLAKYGRFTGVRNYIAVIGRKGAAESCGYYGEQLVLRAQQLGLNSCWVALTYRRVPETYRLDAGEKLYCVIAVGYGKNQGVAHRSKPITRLCRIEGGMMPDWFRRGVQAAALAPTAVNQQNFCFRLIGHSRVHASAGFGPYTHIDLGIAKYHFMLGAGKDNFVWA